MKVRDFIGLIYTENEDTNQIPVCICPIGDAEILYADVIGNIPDELLDAELGMFGLPDTSGDIALTLFIEDYEQSFDDNGMYSSTKVKGNYIRASKYDLVGQDGNAFALMGYTARALKNEGLRDLVPEMQQRATSGDYWNLIAVCDEYVQMANDKAIENGYIDDEDDEW